jgi:hypothetical protein
VITESTGQRPDPLIASDKLSTAVARFGVWLPILEPGQAISWELVSYRNGYWPPERSVPETVTVYGNARGPQRAKTLQPERLCALIYSQRNRLATDPWNPTSREAADSLVADALNQLPTTASYEIVSDRLSCLEAFGSAHPMGTRRPHESGVSSRGVHRGPRRRTVTPGIAEIPEPSRRRSS